MAAPDRLASLTALRPNTHDVFVVEGNGEKENGTQRRFYLVNHECQCPDFHQRKEFHKGWCKHRLAVELVKHNWKPNGKPGNRASQNKAEEER